jgi:hypothetical protein
MRTNKNVVYVEGYVYNFSLFPNVARPNSKNPGQEYINGTVNIATDEDGINIVSVRYTYVTPTWKNGKENETYTILKALIDGAPTWDKDGKDKATKLRIQGDVEVNDFMGRDGNMVETKQVRGGFTHYANDGFRDKRNNFETDIIITSAVRVEVEDGDDYMNLSGYVFNFRNDFIPVTYSLVNEAGIKYFEGLDISMNNPYYTYVWGRIVSSTQRIEKQVETAWGAPQVEYTTRTLRMWVVDGCSPDYYDFDDVDTITLDEFKQGLANREQQKAEAKARQEARNESPTGKSGFPAAANVETPFDKSPVASPTAASNFKF